MGKTELTPASVQAIEACERRHTPEARFVKVVDKTLPKITNILNGGVTFKGQKHDAVTGKEFLEHQRDKLATMALLEELGEKMIREIFA